MHTNYQSELKYLLEDKGRLDYISNLCNSIKDTGNTLILVDRISAGNELASRISIVSLYPGVQRVQTEKQNTMKLALQIVKLLLQRMVLIFRGLIFRIFHPVLLESGKSFLRVIPIPAWY